MMSPQGSSREIRRVRPARFSLHQVVILKRKWCKSNGLPFSDEQISTNDLKVSGFGIQTKESIPTDQNEYYDRVRNTWTAIAPLPGPYHQFSITQVDGNVWFAGGFNGDASTPVDLVWIYDPIANNFSEGPALPAGRAGGSAGAFWSKAALFRRTRKRHRRGGRSLRARPQRTGRTDYVDGARTDAGSTHSFQRHCRWRKDLCHRRTS